MDDTTRKALVMATLAERDRQWEDALREAWTTDDPHDALNQIHPPLNPTMVEVWAGRVRDAFESDHQKELELLAAWYDPDNEKGRPNA